MLKFKSSSLKQQFALLATTALLGIAYAGSEHANPNQAAVDAVNDRNALAAAQDTEYKNEAAAAKDQYPGFSTGFGKQGTLSVETAERDKFHVTARSAEAFEFAAQQLADIINARPAPVILMTDADRTALPIYWREKIVLDRLANQTNAILGDADKKNESATAILGIGSFLSETAQFLQLFKTDKSVSFDESALPDSYLLDLVASKAPTKALYPAASLDALSVSNPNSKFGNDFLSLSKRRQDLQSVTDKTKKDAATKILSDFDALATRLVTVDPTAKTPELLTVIHGEEVDGMLTTAAGGIFSITVAAKGGASLKTSSIWRNDRLYASGGIVAIYRLTSTDAIPVILKAGVVSPESKFIEIPLN